MSHVKRVMTLEGCSRPTLSDALEFVGVVVAMIMTIEGREADGRPKTETRAI